MDPTDPVAVRARAEGEQLAAGAAAHLGYAETPTTGLAVPASRRWAPPGAKPPRRGEVVPQILLSGALVVITGADWCLTVWHDQAPDCWRIHGSGALTRERERAIDALLDADDAWDTLCSVAWEDDRAARRQLTGTRKLPGAAPVKQRTLAPKEDAPVAATAHELLEFGKPPAKPSKRRRTTQ